ncbi:hypothetical protein M405DRAFT_81434 [Rhizopogon salebrosus TDB-379]|nr:hypothetical protein M405DRAFT_81434 [Rhizopogon salebrosus TDB-379]
MRSNVLTTHINDPRKESPIPKPKHQPPARPLVTQCPKNFFAWHTGPYPVTVFAGRPRKLYSMAPRPVQSRGRECRHDAQTTPLSSPATHTAFGMQTHSTPQRPQHPQTQHATRPAQDEEYDCGCWGNFCHVFWRTSGASHADLVASSLPLFSWVLCHKTWGWELWRRANCSVCRTSA